MKTGQSRGVKSEALWVGLLSAPRKRGSGFTLVEVLLVILIIGILTGIGIPIYRDVVQRADAARIIADIHTIQLAVGDHLVDEKVHPATADVGVVPPGLEGRLPENFPFAWGNVRYRYRRWAIPGTSTWERRVARGLPVVGVEVYTDSPALLRHLDALAMGRAVVGADNLTLVLE
jgi:prepilin-type N-terminal cleavage/methylation domain-containing protein